VRTVGLAPLILISLAIAASNRTDGPAAKDGALREDLLSLVKADQDARKEMLAELGRRGVSMFDGKAITDPAKLKIVNEITSRMIAVDARNRARFKQIVDERGWPGKTLVGVDGAGAAFLLAQHADADRPFQKKCLELMRTALEGEVKPSDLAYLTDRDLVGDGKKQRYGTQLDAKDGTFRALPIEDEANVDKRRADVGLPPLAIYLREAETEYRKMSGAAAGSETTKPKVKD
jgi:hypothetical protein